MFKHTLCANARSLGAKTYMWHADWCDSVVILLLLSLLLLLPYKRKERSRYSLGGGVDLRASEAGSLCALT